MLNLPAYYTDHAAKGGALFEGLDNDPEKIGKHMLEMLAKFRNYGIAE